MDDIYDKSCNECNELDNIHDGLNNIYDGLDNIYNEICNELNNMCDDLNNIISGLKVLLRYEEKGMMAEETERKECAEEKADAEEAATALKNAEPLWEEAGEEQTFGSLLEKTSEGARLLMEKIRDAGEEDNFMELYRQLTGGRKARYLIQGKTMYLFLEG